MAPSAPLVLRPGGHAVHWALPLAAEKLPLGHATQAPGELACRPPRYRPAAHGVHVPLSASAANEPAPQAVQAVLPPPLKKPGGHGSQAGRSRKSE